MSSSPLTSTSTVRSPWAAAWATFMSWLTFALHVLLGLLDLGLAGRTRSSAVETSRPTLRRASRRCSDELELLLADEVEGPDDGAVDQDREADGRLEPGRMRRGGPRQPVDRSARSVDDEHVAGLPGLARAALPPRG